VIEILAAASGMSHGIGAILAQAEAPPETGVLVNVFSILLVAANFLVFLLLAWYLGFRRLSGTLETRRERIEQGLRDADAARVEREQAASERLATLAAARQEANEVLARAQRLADESRERQVGETRAEIERLREQATADIESERLRAVADVRAQVADLALLAAGRVVGETMNEPRERRLVEQFLSELDARPSRGRGSRRN
jgi:F-type H+-transporting ATPase subunit b